MNNDMTAAVVAVVQKMERAYALAHLRTWRLKQLQVRHKHRTDCDCSPTTTKLFHFPRLQAARTTFDQQGNETVFSLPWYYAAWFSGDCSFPVLRVFELPVHHEVPWPSTFLPIPERPTNTATPHLHSIWSSRLAAIQRFQLLSRVTCPTFISVLSPIKASGFSTYLSQIEESANEKQWEFHSKLLVPIKSEPLRQTSFIEFDCFALTKNDILQ